MRYDPRKKAAVPDNVPEMPVGTLDELEKHRLPANVWPSCHEPTMDGRVIGCPLWDICTMSYKGKSYEDGGGPRNHCWERVKSPAQGGAVVRNTQPCYFGVAQQEEVGENKAVLQPIAAEGEEYEIETVILKPKPTDLFNREQERIKVEVMPFKRIGESKQMVQARLRSEVMKREQERVAHERASETFNIPGGVTPLDKRSGRSGGSGKKEG